MSIFNPPHPGEFIREIYMTPFGLCPEDIAESLDVPLATFERLLNREIGISPEMALRLSKTLGRSAESWLIMQNQYDLWHIGKKFSLEQVKKLRLVAA